MADPAELPRKRLVSVVTRSTSDPLPGWNVGGDQGSARGRGNMRGQLEAAAEALEGRPLSGEAAVGANGPPSKGAKSNN